MKVSFIESQLAKVARRLAKFDAHSVLSALGGLCTEPANHPNAYRIEALAHLAALRCRGTRECEASHLRNWLNEEIADSVVVRQEDPVEDAFVANVGSSAGNSRIFMGLWEGSDSYLQFCLLAAIGSMSSGWANGCLGPITGMLRLSEEVAARAAVGRNTLSGGLPKQHLLIPTDALQRVRNNVTFSYTQLNDLRITPASLLPFAFPLADVDLLQSDSIGNSMLERFPLWMGEQSLVVALPAAISVACRRFLLETAASHNALPELAESITEQQLRALAGFGFSAWDIVKLEQSKQCGPLLHEIAGVAADSVFVHLIFVQDDLGEVLSKGIAEVQDLSRLVTDEIIQRGHARARSLGLDRGLTIIVHGGIGRGFKADLGPRQTGWKFAAFGLHDFMHLGWDHGFSAVRLWKLLAQRDLLEERGVRIPLVMGVLNFCAYAESRDFYLVPDEFSIADGAMLMIQPDFAGALRQRVRAATDWHLSKLPDRKAWVAVQRASTSVFFKEMEDKPIYVSLDHAKAGDLFGSVETAKRTWWIKYEGPQDNPHARQIAVQLWELTQNWMWRLSEVFESEILDLPTGPFLVTLAMDGELEPFDLSSADYPEIEMVPNVTFNANAVSITCTSRYLAAFCRADNFGDRLMVRALITGAQLLAGQTPSQADVERLEAAVVPNDNARFFHAIPPQSLSDDLLNGLDLPPPKFVQQEDHAWSQLDLAQGVQSFVSDTRLKGKDANLATQAAVDTIWHRVRDKLRSRDRLSVIRRGIENYTAIEKDRSQWFFTASALLALHRDTIDVVEAANRREADRARSAVAARVLLEMAICESPIGGRSLDELDYDELIANIVTLIEVASFGDALHYGLAPSGVGLAKNGMLIFDREFLIRVQQPYVRASSEMVFRAAAGSYGVAFEPAGLRSPPVGADRFDRAFCSEFGMTLRRLAALAQQTTQLSVEKKEFPLLMRRSELKTLLLDGGEQDIHADFALERLLLPVRPQWDESSPRNASRKDWYPWRRNRRLSVITRPILQLNADQDPVCVVAPNMMEAAARYLSQSYDGLLPSSLFQSREMLEWLGSAADRRGHAFNDEVAVLLRQEGFQAHVNVEMSVLGGAKMLGDVDVLAWRTGSEVCWLVECKSLTSDLTIGEIGERVREYADLSSSKRGPLRKHLDRMAFLSRTPAAVLKLMGSKKVRFRSAIVTERLTPLQYERSIHSHVDVVADISSVVSKLRGG